MAILVFLDSLDSPQTIGGAFIRGCAIIRDNTVCSEVYVFQKKEISFEHEHLLLYTWKYLHAFYYSEFRDCVQSSMSKIKGNR